MLGQFHRPRVLRITSASRAFFSTAAATPLSSSVNAGASTDAAKWTPQSKRIGLLARKRGMMSLFDEFGIKVPVTVLQVEDNQVVMNIETPRANGTVYHGVQIGASDMRPTKQSAQMVGHFKKAGVATKRYVKEFDVSPDAHVPVGTKLSAIHFVPGQYVDVTAKSVGKGFQGVMKRWGFSGLPATHGTSASHRSAGSTGQHQDPGRVWPGTKMAGRMGGKRRTLLNMVVMRVESDLGLIFVKGNVPGTGGSRGAVVSVRDAVKKLTAEAKRKEMRGDENVLPRGVLDLPFPAGTVEMAKRLPSIIATPSARITNPFVPQDS